MNPPPRKLKLRSDGRLPAVLGVEGVPLPGSVPARPIEDQKPETSRVVNRLAAVVAAHATSARRMGYPLTNGQVLAVLDALRTEAEGTIPPASFQGNEVAAYLQQILYEELLEEPSNVFYSTRVSEDVMRYEPLPREFWLACLEGLRVRLARLGLSPAASASDAPAPAFHEPR